MVRGVVFFDVDGTLVPGATSSQHLASHLGHLGHLAAAEEDYRQGRIDNDAVSILDAAGWRGHRAIDVMAWLQDLPLVEGVHEVVAWCRKMSLAPYLATLAWQPVGDHLCETFGFDGSCGPGLLQEGNRYTGQVSSHLDEFGKRDYALDVAARLGLTTAQCAAVGDSRSDLPLFERVGFAVAFNGDSAAVERADAIAEGADLRLVLPHLVRWLKDLPPAS